MDIYLEPVPVWRLDTACGMRLDSFAGGGWGSTDRPGEELACFPPTAQRDLDIVLTAIDWSGPRQASRIDMPLVAGERITTSRGDVEIAAVERVGGQTLIDLRWTGAGHFGPVALDLLDGNGQSLLYQMEPDGARLRLRVDQHLPAGEGRLSVTQLHIHQPVGITVPIG